MNRLGSLLPRRRPSAAMVVAVTALVLAATGAGYAATYLPAGSVGNKQIKNGAVSNWKLSANAVGFRKIIPHTIGRVRVDQNAVQLRVTGTCGSGQAISSVANTGKVSCSATRPSEYGTPGTTATVNSSSSPAVVASESLPAGSSYVGFADPQIAVTGTAGTSQQVTVTCELALGTGTAGTATRTATVNVSAAHPSGYVTLPLTATADSSSNATTGAVVCVRAVSGTGAAPTVTAVSNLNVLQTASNTASATPTTTSTAPYTVTTPPTGTGTTTTTTTGTTTAP